MVLLSALRRLSSCAGKGLCTSKRCCWGWACGWHLSACHRLWRPCESRAFRHSGKAPWPVQLITLLWMVCWTHSWHWFTCAVSLKNNAVFRSLLHVANTKYLECLLSFEYQHNIFHKKHIKWLGNETINWFYNEAWNQIDFEIELREAGVWSD